MGVSQVVANMKQLCRSFVVVPPLLAIETRAEQAVINGIMYHPPGTLPEYLEVYNHTATPFDMFSDGVDYVFPAFSAGGSDAHLPQALRAHSRRGSGGPLRGARAAGVPVRAARPHLRCANCPPGSPHEKCGTKFSAGRRKPRASGALYPFLPPAAVFRFGVRVDS
jgi:hypothetical protein